MANDEMNERTRKGQQKVRSPQRDGSLRGKISAAIQPGSRAERATHGNQQPPGRDVGDDDDAGPPQSWRDGDDRDRE